MSPPILIFLSPLLLVLELVQLVLAERYLGVKQIERGFDPRTQEMSEGLAFCWSVGILTHWVWMVTLLPLRFGTGQVVCMLVTSMIGYAIRRGCALKWVLVTLTLEGAIRVGMHISLLSLAWKLL
ncbi:MAG TPA: hypothetical protein PKX00_15595 [Opitutaceae bacterium]|jgi:hypothetical protein|nr:hypothetical protein [Opitutaceae bacterium]HRE07036.1 hypothetical protein [Opitutaceae bacterium]